MTPAERLAALQSLGWSVRALAERLGVSEATVRQWQRGRRSPPPAIDEWLARLAQAVTDDPPPRRRET